MDHIKIALRNFSEGCFKPVAVEWATYKYVKGYEDLKIFYDGKIINLITVPTFFSEYMYLPGQKTDALVQIKDVVLHYGQFKENDPFEIWHYNTVSETYLIIGEGVFKEIIQKELSIWNTEMFTKRYSKKIEEIPEYDGIIIDCTDAFGRLKFVDYININKKKRGNLLDVELLINTTGLTTSDLNDLLAMVSFISYETTRYKIDYTSHIVEKTLKYKNVQIDLASWSSKVYFTISLSCIFIGTKHTKTQRTI